MCLNSLEYINLILSISACKANSIPFEILIKLLEGVYKGSYFKVNLLLLLSGIVCEGPSLIRVLSERFLKHQDFLVGVAHCFL